MSKQNERSEQRSRERIERIAKEEKATQQRIERRTQRITQITQKIENLRKVPQTPQIVSKIQGMEKRVTVIQQQIKVIQTRAQNRAQRREENAQRRVQDSGSRVNTQNGSIAKLRIEVAQKNQKLRTESNSDLRIIREDKSKIATLKKQLETSPAPKKMEIIKAIKETQDDIEAKVERVTRRREEIIQNKQIIVRRIARRVQISPERRVLKRREIVEVVNRKIKVYRERIEKLERRIAQLKESERGCKDQKCRNQHSVQIQEITHRVHREIERIKQASKYQDEITKIIQQIHRIKLVKTYYKNNVTCNKADNLKAFRVIRKQRLAVIKRSTKNIVRLEKANSPSDREHLRRWRDEVNKQIKAIDNDKKKTNHVILTCSKLFNNGGQNQLVGEKTQVDSGCHIAKIRAKANKANSNTNARIQAIQAKVAKASAQVKTASGAIKAKLEAKIQKLNKKVASQLKLIKHDQKMYKSVIRQCQIIKTNSLTVTRRRTGVTCDPITLRNRVHSLVNAHYLVILRAKNNIKINELRLTSEKNASARKALINGIAQFRTLVAKKQAEANKAKKNLKQAISVCKKYGYFIKNVIRVKQFRFGGQNKKFVIRRYKLYLKKGFKRLRGVQRFKYVRKFRIVRTKDGKLHRYARFVRVRVSGSKKVVKRTGAKSNISVKWSRGHKKIRFVKTTSGFKRVGNSKYSLRMVRRFKTFRRKFHTKRGAKMSLRVRYNKKRRVLAH